MKTPRNLALLSLLLPLVAARAQTTYSWTGATGGDWNTASNWSPSTAAPGAGAGDVAGFDADVPASAVSLGSATTIARLNFLSGAGAYTFSGSELTLAGATATYLSNQSGRVQTFNNAMRITATGTVTFDVGAGGSLAFNSTVTGPGSSRSLVLQGGGAVAFNGAFASYTSFNQIQVRDGTTLNYNTSTQNGASNYWAQGGRINLFRSTGAGGVTLTLRSDNSEIHLSTAGMTQGAANLVFRGDTAGETKTFGADFSGADTATFSGPVRLNNTAASANNTYRLFAAAGNTLALTGVVSDDLASASGTRVLVAGPGVVRFAGTGANTSLTPVAIDGTLELAKTDGVDALAGGPVTINPEGTLRLAAANQIADSTALGFSGGVFAVNGFSETLGALSVDANGGTLDFGGADGHLVFSGLDSIGGGLLIEGWTLGSSITFTSIAGIGDAELALISFAGFGGAVLDGNQLVASAVPEPSSAALALGSVALLGGLARRKRRSHA